MHLIANGLSHRQHYKAKASNKAIPLTKLKPRAKQKTAAKLKKNAATVQLAEHADILDYYLSQS